MELVQPMIVDTLALGIYKKYEVAESDAPDMEEWPTFDEVLDEFLEALNAESEEPEPISLLGYYRGRAFVTAWMKHMILAEEREVWTVRITGDPEALADICSEMFKYITFNIAEPPVSPEEIGEELEKVMEKYGKYGVFFYGIGLGISEEVLMLMNHEIINDLATMGNIMMNSYVNWLRKGYL